MEHADLVVADGEEDSINVRLAAVEEMPNFFNERGVLGSQGTSQGRLAERLDGVSNLSIPSARGFFGTLGEPERNGFQILGRRFFKNDTALHEPRR